MFVDASPSWSPGTDLSVQIDGDKWSIGSFTTAWWRRPGVADGRTGDELEDRLIAEETAALFPGMLAATGVRWVDAPWDLVRARLKPLQLAAARSAGAVIPGTLITGDMERASGFGSAGDVLAKATSTGFGIAPHVAAVPREELRRVTACPTTLQRPVDADADLRVVTIGNEIYTWERRRASGEPIDWRAADPQGSDFKHVSGRRCPGATAVAECLGLTFSVQDWLSTDDGDVFLEVNPQGQWLFLEGADRRIVPALAQHLSGLMT
jgi:glutathione synthase/RimK-type ligase-like ATP-grasp enzyme